MISIRATPLAIYIASVVLLGACATTESKEQMGKHSIQTFSRAITADFTAEKARTLFGDPARDVGSGLYIYLYEVKEGGTLTLVFDSRLREARYDHDEESEVLFTREELIPERTDLLPALQQYINGLKENEKSAIPAEYRGYLLKLIPEARDSIGGWYLDKMRAPWTLTRWHIVSDYLRVAAVLDVEKQGTQWTFKNLRLASARTSPPK